MTAYTTRFEITFHPLDDLSAENRDRIEGSCLTTVEAETAKWSDKTLTFLTNQNPLQTMEGFEDQGFNLEEFVSVKFSPVNS